MTAPSPRPVWTIAVLALAGLCIGLGMDRAVGPPDVIPMGLFSEMTPSQALPKGWEPLSLAAAYKKTEYALVRSDRGTVVRARSNNGSSGLITERRVDLTTHPILTWHWKISGIVEDGKAGDPERDDLPARLIVSFDYTDLSLYRRLKIVALRALGYNMVSPRALIYFWGNRVHRHTVVPWPDSGWVQTIATQSGSTRVGTWVRERRNVRADYRRVFGEEPPTVEGVGIVTDTENTGDSVTAYYGDIVFRTDVPDSTTADTTLHLPPVHSTPK